MSSHLNMPDEIFVIGGPATDHAEFIAGPYTNSKSYDVRATSYTRTDIYNELKSQRDELLAALKELWVAKRPGYHDCLDNGEPECEWCLAEKAIKRAEENK